MLDTAALSVPTVSCVLPTIRTFGDFVSRQCKTMSSSNFLNPFTRSSASRLKRGACLGWLLSMVSVDIRL